jgi:hypothetical protein
VKNYNRRTDLLASHLSPHFDGKQNRQFAASKMPRGDYSKRPKRQDAASMDRFYAAFSRRQFTIRPVKNCAVIPQQTGTENAASLEFVDSSLLFT